MAFKQKKYLSNEPLAEAIRKYSDALTAAHIVSPLAGERIPVADAPGRVTSEAVIAKISSPFYHSAAMDGYAVRFIDTFGAGETRPRRLAVPEQSVAVDTGDPLPDGFDAVIMIEDVEKTSEAEIEILKPATPWQHVRLVGEDIVATELIIPENHVIRPVDMAAMIASGHTTVMARRRPVVAVIPTGTELVEPGSELKKGDIIDFNSTMLSAMAAECGARAVRTGIVRDEAALLAKTVLGALADSDLVVINAGSSAGREDFTADVLAGLGRVLVHGVSIKPGKPVILAIVQGKPVIGIPGYPVSAALTFALFVKPLIYALQGLKAPEAETVTARLSRQVASSLGQEEFIRVKLGSVAGNLIATPVTRGAGALMSLVRADGIIRVPAMSEGIAAGQEIGVELLRTGGDIRNTIVCIGSHDNALDVLGNYLKKKHPELTLSSAHVGSMGGLLAIKRGEAHVAGTHLLDEETGEYNVSYIRKLLPDTRTVLVNLVHRTQGFIVPKGNPKGIRGFEDLVRPDVVFVNRQAGAGTRLLTDLSLRKLKIDPNTVKGYHHEEFTHMAVAAAVASGAADTGLAVLSAAQALGLDFIPVAQERYDLAVPQEFYETPMVQALFGIIRGDKGFREEIIAMGGYDVSEMGKVLGVL
ncbi:MAG TPA: molybdopterin biosynthesis protein [Nitrospirota bacterium]|nr:molybdopterin biosynthesis protein [Nitrospirota bacterium]